MAFWKICLIGFIWGALIAVSFWANLEMVNYLEKNSWEYGVRNQTLFGTLFHSLLITLFLAWLVKTAIAPRQCTAGIAIFLVMLIAGHCLMRYALTSFVQIS